MQTWDKWWSWFQIVVVVAVEAAIQNGLDSCSSPSTDPRDSHVLCELPGNYFLIKCISHISVTSSQELNHIESYWVQTYQPHPPSFCILESSQWVICQSLFFSILGRSEWHNCDCYVPSLLPGWYPQALSHGSFFNRSVHLPLQMTHGLPLEVMPMVWGWDWQYRNPKTLHLYQAGAQGCPTAPNLAMLWIKQPILLLKAPHNDQGIGLCF